MTQELQGLLAGATPGPWKVAQQPVDGADAESIAHNHNSIWREMPQGLQPVFGLSRVRPSDIKAEWPAASYCRDEDAALIVWLRNNAETLLASLTAKDAEIAALRADAERWRAFISSERFYVMGAAGFTWEPPAVDPDRDRDNWLHFTLNIWDKHPAGDDAQGRHGRALLLAYVEHLRAARALHENPESKA